MLEKLKEEVYKANMDLPIRTCYIYMGKCKRNRQRIRTFVIKPSGVDYDLLTPDDMVVVDLNGNKVEGKYNPSSDTATHVELYKAFPNIGGVVHTHSSWATSWHRPEDQSHVMEPHMQIIFMVKFHVHAAWKARNLKNMRKTQDF